MKECLQKGRSEFNDNYKFNPNSKKVRYNKSTAFYECEKY